MYLAAKMYQYKNFLKQKKSLQYCCLKIKHPFILNQASTKILTIIVRKSPNLACCPGITTWN